tara:strand:- start:590 stop:865 length:276 start_codon:yes stop_codon:yes gene_type:complete
MVDFHKAIIKLNANVVRVSGDTKEEIKAFDESENEVTINWTEVEAWVDPDEYKYKRASEYPSIVDQLDDLYHNGIDGWKTTIKAVKDKYPK